MERLLRPCIAEMVGTFALCFIGAGTICTNSLLDNGGSGLLGVAIAHGVILAIAVSATMNISGGHVNPAVTITMWVYKRIEGDRLILYVISQLLGAVIAGGFLLLIFGQSAEPANLGTPHINEQLLHITDETSSWARWQRQATAIGIEAILTFLLVFAVFGTVVDPRAPRIGGFGVGLTVMVDILMGGPLVGASMNPARTFGTGIWEGGAFGWDRFFRDHLVYWLGPVLGGMLAGGVYLSYIMPPEKPDLAKVPPK